MNKKMKVAVLDDYLDLSRAFADWSRLEALCDVDVFSKHISKEDAPEILRKYDIICHMRERMAMPADLIRSLPNLKMISITSRRHRTLDLRAAGERGIVICHSTRPDIGQYAAPELAWGLVLATTKNIALEDRRMRLGHWQTRLGLTLYGKTLGLLGFGFTGQRMSEFGRAFGMDVVTWSQNLDRQAASAAGARPVTKDELFSVSDVLSIHLVLGKRTTGIVGAKEISLMKETAFLINSSRGPLVDEDALISALSSGRIAGAGLDVFDVEPLPLDHRFRSLDNVVVTPHIGFNTAEVMSTYYKDTIEVIDAYLSGKPIRLVDPQEDWT